MASNALSSWSFSQRFSWRPSTLLLAYLAVFAAAGTAQPWLPGLLQMVITWAQETLGPGALLVLFPAAILALAFFIGSLLKRNPQLQFVLEVLAAVAALLLTPTY